MNAILRSCALFRNLSADQIDAAVGKSFHQIRSFREGDMIAQSGEEVSSMMIILEGSIRGEMIDFSGKTIKIEDREPAQLIAPAFLFGKNNRFPVTITANEPLRLLILPRNSLLKLMQEDLVILHNYLNIISNRAQFLSNKIRFLSFQSIKGKIAHMLLEQVQKSGSDEITLPLTQAEMADLFGVARPSLGRTIRELDRDGLIEAKGKLIRILDREKLSGLLR